MQMCIEVEILMSIDNDTMINKAEERILILLYADLNINKNGKQLCNSISVYISNALFQYLKNHILAQKLGYYFCDLNHSLKLNEIFLLTSQPKL